jgi:DNA-binding CsgD family transcriptional regulator
MSRSNRLRLAHLRAAYLLAAECRELGDDPHLWRRHWLRIAASLVGADIAVSVETAKVRAGEPRDLGFAEWGWENGFNRAGWEAALAEFHDHPDLILTPPLRRYFRRMVKDSGIALVRSDLMADRTWYRSWNYNHLNLLAGVDHTLWCFGFVPLGNGDELAGVLLSRAIGDRDFTARERAIVRELQAAVTPLIGGPLARFADPSPSTLSPRVRQVLKCLLEGDGDKQIATRLGLKRHTVNEYVDKIFRHFGVVSRPELLARWVRRGWGGKFAWADTEIAGREP